MIYFATIHLKRVVHAHLLGFTKTLYVYCWGADVGEAESHAFAYCLGNGAEPEFCSSIVPAQQQDPERYTFVEQVYGLPLDAATHAIRSKRWPDSMTERTLRDLAASRQLVDRGRELLAASHL